MNYVHLIPSHIVRYRSLYCSVLFLRLIIHQIFIKQYLLVLLNCRLEAMVVLNQHYQMVKRGCPARPPLLSVLQVVRHSIRQYVPTTCHRLLYKVFTRLQLKARTVIAFYTFSNACSIASRQSILQTHLGFVYQREPYRCTLRY